MGEMWCGLGVLCFLSEEAHQSQRKILCSDKIMQVVSFFVCYWNINVKIQFNQLTVVSPVPDMLYLIYRYVYLLFPLLHDHTWGGQTHCMYMHLDIYICRYIDKSLPVVSTAPRPHPRWPDRWPSFWLYRLQSPPPMSYQHLQENQNMHYYRIYLYSELAKSKTSLSMTY